MNLILLEGEEISDGGLATLTGARSTHVHGVLRAVPGTTIRIGLINGPLGTATVVKTSPGETTISCEFQVASPEPPRVDLLLALPRPKVLKRLWAQIAAVGVGHIVLTNAARVERNYFDTHVLTPEGYRPLLLEGLQQAKDTHLPRVTIRRTLKPLIEDDLDTLFPSGLRLLADPDRGSTIAQVTATAPAERVLVAIGPEGGWVDFERNLLARHGFLGVSMGPRTLRSDTACVALLALVHDALRAHAESAQAFRPATSSSRSGDTAG